MDERTFQQTYQVAFLVGFHLNVPSEACTEDGWREIEARQVAAYAAGDAWEYGYLSGILSRRNATR
jgi:hypothetical protein